MSENNSGKILLSGGMTAGLILIVLGILFLLGNLFHDFRVWHFIGNLWPIILIVVGVMIILHRNRNRIHVGGVNASDQARFIGDFVLDYSGKEVGEVNSSHFIGDLTVDLSGARLKSGDNVLNISLFIGDVMILVPADFPVKISSRAFIGDQKYDRMHEEGMFPKMDHADDSFESAERKLFINYSSFIGDFTLKRVSK